VGSAGNLAKGNDEGAGGGSANVGASEDGSGHVSSEDRDVRVRSPIIVGRVQVLGKSSSNIIQSSGGLEPAERGIGGPRVAGGCASVGAGRALADGVPGVSSSKVTCGHRGKDSQRKVTSRTGRRRDNEDVGLVGLEIEIVLDGGLSTG